MLLVIVCIEIFAAGERQLAHSAAWSPGCCGSSPPSLLNCAEAIRRFCRVPGVNRASSLCPVRRQLLQIFRTRLRDA